MSKGTSKMLLAGSIFAGMPCLQRERCVICIPGEPLTLGDFRVTAYPVDHSAFDSMAFLIEADGKSFTPATCACTAASPVWPAG